MADSNLTKQALVELGLNSETAQRICVIAQSVDGRDDMLSAWRTVCESLLSPEMDFAAHKLVHDAIFGAWDNSDSPRPVWVPSGKVIENSNVFSLTKDPSFSKFQRRSVEDPEWFWAEMLERLKIQASNITTISDISANPETGYWLPDAEMNIASSCFLERNQSKPAIIRGRQNGEIETISIEQLKSRANRVAHAIEALGLPAGSPIAIDMPMTAESVEIYLGIVLAGSIVVSIADSFSPTEIRTRLEIAGAKAIFTQDFIIRGNKRIPLYSRVKEATDCIAVVLPAQDRVTIELVREDLSWEEFLSKGGNKGFSPSISKASTTTNILFSSGTTGTPKAIPWTQLTPIKAAADAWAHHDIHEGDVVAWPTNLGWMMGPWLIYASLLNGAAIAIFEGSPLGAEFTHFVEKAEVTMLGVVPSIVRAWKANGATDGVDWSKIKAFSSTGEASNPTEMHWLMSRAGYSPVIEYCGGTEIGGGYITGSVLQPQAAATFSTPAIGTGMYLLDENGTPATSGEVALCAPMLGSSERLLNADHHKIYFSGMSEGPNGETLRRHGDQINSVGGGYFRAMGRVDDTMNLGGIKISSAELERACGSVDGVKELAAVAVPQKGGGPSELVLAVVLTGDSKQTAGSLLRTFQLEIRRTLNPLFKVSRVELMTSLPRTASNKVMRRLIRDGVSQ